MSSVRNDSRRIGASRELNAFLWKLRNSGWTGIMTRKLHPSASTGSRIRREIQQSGESNRALAARLGVDPKTVAKWKGRPTTSDARKGPRKPVSTVLSLKEEALIVIFRQRTRLPVDDCLTRLKPLISDLSRSALHRCLERNRVSRIPKGQARKLPDVEDQEDRGYFAVEIHAVPDEMGEVYVYTAISSFCRLFFARTSNGVSADHAARFLADLVKHSPVKISRVETSRHEAFADPDKTSKNHPFGNACRANGILHIVAKSVDPTLKMVSKGWVGIPRWWTIPFPS